VGGGQPRIFFAHSGAHKQGRSLIYLIKLDRDAPHSARCLEVDAAESYDRANGFGDVPKPDYLIQTEMLEIAPGVKEMVPKCILGQGEYALWAIIPSLDLNPLNQGICIGRIYSFGID
jgi:hypothetical protein